MGKRGPTRTPLQILEQRGSWLAKRRKNEPVPPKGPLPCPKDLSPRAKKVWKKLVPQLKAMGIVGACDRNALTRYCELFALWQEYAAFIRAHGPVHKVTKDGQTIGVAEWPQTKALRHLSKLLSGIEREFGMTPGARANLAQELPSDPDENRGKWERIINGFEN